MRCVEVLPPKPRRRAAGLALEVELDLLPAGVLVPPGDPLVTDGHAVESEVPLVTMPHLGCGVVLPPTLEEGEDFHALLT